MPLSPRTSRPATPSSSTTNLHATTSSSKSRYGAGLYHTPHFTRSRSTLPQPKVLPFPDLPVRPISHESSRASSPYASPALTRRSSSQDVNNNNNIPPRVTVNPAGPSSESIVTLSQRASDSSSSTSQLPSAFSPSSGPSGSIQPIQEGVQVPPRMRAQTTPSSTGRPIPVPPILNLNTPNRTQHGFNPVAITPPSGPSSNLDASPSPAVPRASSLPTSAPVVPPILRDTPRPPPPVKKLSNPPQSPAPAMQLAPPSSHQVLSDHMYQSFLKGTCADVRLYVRKWGVGWLVHKVILVQAGFFHSLFLGGFSEMSRSSNDKGKAKAVIGDDWHGEDVELTFDDPNITRAAFEICLSRLYSPYPHLHFPSILLPTPQHPLTPSFPPRASNDPTSLRSIQDSIPPHSVLATPRLLLSVLATTIYLGHSTLMREVLAMIPRTVGPATVGRYLAFAVGDGIGDEEWEGQTEEGSKGLEDVTKRLDIRRESDTLTTSNEQESLNISHSSSHSLSDDGTKCGHEPALNVNTSEGSTPTVSYAFNFARSGSRPASIAESISALPHFYGFASNKIGEACACWLARWGVDLLDIELASPTLTPIWSHRGLPADFLRAVLSADTFFVRDEMERYTVTRRVLDLRRRGWEEEMESKGDISVAESIAETEGWDAWEADEEELARVFADGIYYTHMTFEDLSTIAADIDPTTSLPYVPLSVLQAAHWAAANLRNKILGPNTNEQDLGMITTASALVAPDTKRRRVTPRSRAVSASASALSLTSNESPSRAAGVYHPIPIDDTHRLGAGGQLFLAALASATTPLPGIPGVPDLGPELDSYSVEGARPAKFRPPPQGEKTAFGLVRGCKTTSELLEEHALSLNGLSLRDTAQQRWTKAEPYRFSVEFWGVDKLAEKERAYSETHFYAGSWFNVYVQTIRKKDKGTQLGIYLHRQNPAEAFPPVSSSKIIKTKVDQPVSATTVEEAMTAAPPLDTPLMGGTRMYRTMSTPPVTIGSPPGVTRGLTSPTLGNLTISPTEDRVKEDDKAPYKDPRRVTRAYFSISCASALGTALIRFSSAPDNFTISQSWGWKSSALRSEEYLASLSSPTLASSAVMSEPGESLDGGVLGWVGDVGELPREGSLRATVVVGVV